MYGLQIFISLNVDQPINGSISSESVINQIYPVFVILERDEMFHLKLIFSSKNALGISWELTTWILFTNWAVWKSLDIVAKNIPF